MGFKSFIVIMMATLTVSATEIRRVQKIHTGLMMGGCEALEKAEETLYSYGIRIELVNCEVVRSGYHADTVRFSVKDRLKYCRNKKQVKISQIPAWGKNLLIYVGKTTVDAKKLDEKPFSFFSKKEYFQFNFRSCK